MTHYETGAESVPEELRAMLEMIGPARSFAKNSVIYSQGENADCFYYLKKGRISIFMTSEGGTEKTLSIISSGSILGEAAFFDGKPRVSSARTMSRSELVNVSREMLMDMIARDPGTAMALLKHQAQTIRMLSSQLDSVTFVNVKGRIAQFLLRAYHTTGNMTIVTTHEEIAGVVGASRVTVSKLMTQLSRSGCIKTGYGFVTILSVDELEQITG